MGMIRVSDEVEGRLKGVADGRSMNSVIEKMLAYCSSPDGFCYAPQADSRGDSIIGKLDYLENYLDKRFSKLESLVEDTTVDRVAKGGGGGKEYVDWPVVQHIFYDVCADEGAPEWPSTNIYNQVRELNDELNCFVKDGWLCVQDHYGKEIRILKVTERVRNVIDNKLTG